MISSLMNVFGVGLFLYLIWRKLREDYKDDLIISYSWLAVLLALIVGRTLFGLLNWGVWNENPIDWFLFWQKPGFDYVGGIGGLMLATIWTCKKNDWKLWPFLESINGIIYLLIFFLMIGKFGGGLTEIKEIFFLVIIAFGWILSTFVSKRYRGLVWYKSGKKGFVFFFVNAVIMFLLAIDSIVFKDRWFVTIIYLISGLIFLGGLFILGEVFGNFLNFNKRKTDDR